MVVFSSTQLHKKSNSKVSNIAFTSFYYDLEHPQKTWILSDDLNEISGNDWLDKNHLLVIEDLHPILYFLRMDSMAVIEKKTTFLGLPDKKFDLEDVTTISDTIYALWSHGVIYKITGWKSNIQVKEIRTFLNKNNNPEGICYDPVSHNLLLACKGETGIRTEKKSTRAVFEFDTGGDSLKIIPFLLIHKWQFDRISPVNIDFNPSAIAVHPQTHEIYILSTRGSKCMAAFTHQGDLISVQSINPELLPQPEGICFAPDGVLYISSEGKKGAGRICKFIPFKK